MSEPSLCLPPLPSFLPCLPLCWCERPGLCSAAMDRYSMEELIQLGQGRARQGLGCRGRGEREGPRPLLGLGPPWQPV